LPCRPERSELAPRSVRGLGERRGGGRPAVERLGRRPRRATPRAPRGRVGYLPFGRGHVARAPHRGGGLAPVRVAPDSPLDRRRGVRRPRRRAYRLGRVRSYLPGPGSRAPLPKGIALTCAGRGPSGAAEGSHRPERNLVANAVAVRRCPSARGGDALAQDRDLATRHRASD
jgi:hypothetical protein